MNELDEWCVPEEVSWTEGMDYAATSVIEANIDPRSTMHIGDWIASAMSVKWPCDESVDNSVVTDPELIKRLNELYRQAQEEAGD